MFKFQLRQTVFTLKDNKISRVKIKSRKYVDNVISNDMYPERVHPFDRAKVGFMFGRSGVRYYCDDGGIYTEDRLFNSKEALLIKLMEEPVS